jgi:hypothetical protein
MKTYYEECDGIVTVHNQNGLTFVPSDMFSINSWGSGQRKPWRRRVTDKGRQPFYGLVVIERSPFGTRYFRMGEKDQSLNDYPTWELLSTRKPETDWIP